MSAGTPAPGASTAPERAPAAGGAARGTVLFAHGSRDPLWQRPIEAVARQVRAADPGALVACAYLEHSRPDLTDAVGALVGQGAGRIAVVPLFLGVGRHLREDLPALIERLRADRPGLMIELRPSVGEDARVLATIAQVAMERTEP